MRKFVFSFILLTVVARGCPGSLTGYEAYTSWDNWARVSVGTTDSLASSYDRSGGNDDYSQYEWPIGLIKYDTTDTVRTIDGPGIVWRFWMPHLTAK